MPWGRNDCMYISIDTFATCALGHMLWLLHALTRLLVACRQLLWVLGAFCGFVPSFASRLFGGSVSSNWLFKWFRHPCWQVTRVACFVYMPCNVLSVYCKCVGVCQVFASVGVPSVHIRRGTSCVAVAAIPDPCTVVHMSPLVGDAKQR